MKRFISLVLILALLFSLPRFCYSQASGEILEWIERTSGISAYPYQIEADFTDNGDGTISLALPTADPGGSDTQVQFNDNGSFGGDSAFTWDKETDTLNITNLTVSGLAAGSILYAGTGGTVSEDNTEFYWDPVYNRLGLGTKVFLNSKITAIPGVSDNPYIKIDGSVDPYIGTSNLDGFYLHVETTATDLSAPFQVKGIDLGVYNERDINSSTSRFSRAYGIISTVDTDADLAGSGNHQSQAIGGSFNPTLRGIDSATGDTTHTLTGIDISANYRMTVNKASGSTTINAYGIKASPIWMGTHIAGTLTANWYGGYFTATGNTSGAQTAVGVYARAVSADTNYDLYLAGSKSVYDGTNEITVADMKGAYDHKTTEDAISGLVKCNGSGNYSAVTDNSANWDAAYTHVSNNGSDHSYIDQDVTFGSTPTFGIIKGTPHHLRFTIIDPAAAYDKDTQVCVWKKVDAAITITNLEVTCDADPDTEPTGDLKYADAFIGLANAVVINDFDTTNGERSDSSISSGSVAAGKCIYIEFDVKPDTNITQMAFDITYDYD